MIHHILIGCMIVCYIVPILIVYIRYSSNNSISNIITNKTCKPYILFFIFLMGTFSLLYEAERNDIYSLCIVGILLFGIYGVIYINEIYFEHFVFASIVFLSILGFMGRQVYLHTDTLILFSSFFINICIVGVLLMNLHKNIFYPEVVYILNFACFYLYLHFITYGFL